MSLSLQLLSLATPRTVACQAPLSMGFSRQRYWSGLPFMTKHYSGAEADSQAMKGLGSRMKSHSLYPISIKEPVKDLDRAWSIICYAENTPEVVLTDLSLSIRIIFQFLLPFLSFSSSGLTTGINFATGISLVHHFDIWKN